MRVSIFDQYGALNSVPVFAAFRQGCAAQNIQCNQHDLTADVAVIWSQVWAGRMAANRAVWQTFRDSGRPVVVLEVGMLFRGRTWKLGLNGTGLAAYPAAELQVNRARALGIQLQPWRQSGQHIVIAAQRSDSEQWAGQPDSSTWLQHVVTELKKHTDRQVVVRKHPRQTVNIPGGCSVELPRKLINTYDVFNFDQSIQSAWAVVNWNSGPGSQAVIAGVAAFVGASSLAAPVANLDLSQIENPLRPDRTQWIQQLAHTEWTIDEISNGYPIQRLLARTN